MLYSEFEVNGKEYKLRLGARDIVKLEKKLGGNPMNIFMAVENGDLPRLEAIILILQASMTKYHSGMSVDDVYDLYDEYMAEGGTYMEMIPVLLDIFKVSGFFKEETIDEAKADELKNI